MNLAQSNTSASPPPPAAAEFADAALARSIGRTLRGLRRQHGLSLNELAEDSGVSRSMLSQMENGRSTPSVAVLWKIAKALDVPLHRFLEDWESPMQPLLLRKEDTPRRLSAQGRCTWRTLKPSSQERCLEFHEVTLRGGAQEQVPAAAEGSWANLALNSGELIVALAGSRQILRPGDALQFPADAAYALINQGREPAVMYLVVSEQRGIGRRGAP